LKNLNQKHGKVYKNIINFFVNYFRRPWKFKRKMDEISFKMCLKNEKKVDGSSLEKWMEVLG